MAGSPVQCGAAAACAGAAPGTLVTLYDREYRVVENRIVTGRRRTGLMWFINIASLFMTVAALAAGVALVLAFHDLSGSYNIVAGTLILIGLILSLIVAHELVHLLGYRWFGGVSGARVRLGFNKKSFFAYAICMEPVDVRATRRTLLLPLWICGLLPFAAGILWGSLTLVIAGAVLIGGSAGDLWYLWDLRRLDRNSLVMELMPDTGGYAMGVLVLTPS